MYHALWPAQASPDDLMKYWAQDPQLREPGTRVYALEQTAFRRQMQSLARAGAQQPAQWGDLDRQTPSCNQVWITFDDGHQSNCELALPVLQEFGLVAIFFITTDWIGQPGFMTPPQIRQLRAAGHLIGAHGCSHRYFDTMTEEDLRRELSESKRRLEELLGEEVPAMALPGGKNHPQIQRLAREAGYRHLFTSRIALADRAGADPLDWPRIPITNRLPENFLERILHGDTRGVRRLARRAQVLRSARALLGGPFYERVRTLLFGR